LAEHTRLEAEKPDPCDDPQRGEGPTHKPGHLPDPPWYARAKAAPCDGVGGRCVRCGVETRPPMLCEMCLSELRERDRRLSPTCPWFTEESRSCGG
jgi:hypothetical protein